MDRGKGVEQPHELGRADQQKAEYDDRSYDVGEDQDVLAVVAVGKHAGNRTDQKRRQHAHHEEAADGESRAGQRGNQGSRGDEIEPVPQQADDLTEPE